MTTRPIKAQEPPDAAPDVGGATRSAASGGVTYARSSEDTEGIYRLSCLEVRGGNHLAAYAAELPGLTGWLSCQPLEPSPGGGDIYYMSACSEGNIARIVIADVSGHGDAVSSAAITLRNALRRNVDRREQAAMLRQLNESFLETEEGGRFATAFVASFHSGTGELLFTNAGHLPPLWYRAETRTWSLLYDSVKPDERNVDLPLGLLTGTTYTETAMQLEFGDLLILYTDGVSESRDLSGEQMGLHGLLSIARGLPTGSPAAAGQRLRAAVSEFRGGTLPMDDETVVAIQRRAA
jgi:serine phosphatase RsbU (regulator of sigma subunit)